MTTPPHALSNSTRIARLETSNAELRAQVAELERWADRLVGILGRYGILVTTPKFD